MTKGTITCRILSGILLTGLSLDVFDVLAATLTVKNYEYDLCTVTVSQNGEVLTPASTDGKTVAVYGVNGEVTLTAGGFQDDYYFRFAPVTVTNRTLSLERWDGLPAGVDAGTNPVSFTITGDLTVTPNLNCSSNVWNATNTASMIDGMWTLPIKNLTPSSRSVAVNGYTSKVGTPTVVDYAKRVLYKGTNYTVTSMKGGQSGALTIRVPKRLNTVEGDSGFGNTNFIGLAESSVTKFGSHCFVYAQLKGDVADYLPPGLTFIDGVSFYSSSGLFGKASFPSIVTLGGSRCVIAGTSGIKEIYAPSPALATIGDDVFASAPIKKITLGPTNLTSCYSTAFPVAFTNLTWLAAPPKRDLFENILVSVGGNNGAHSLSLYVPLTEGKWWDYVAIPTAEEVTAGIPEGCLGVYVTTASARKAWMFSTVPTDGVLLETDMTQNGNFGSNIHTGLQVGAEGTFSRTGFDRYDLQHFNSVSGAWETFSSVVSNICQYIHNGNLTRLLWKVDGYAIHASSTAYSGTFTFDGERALEGFDVFKPGTQVTVTAAGATVHPTSRFIRWTEGIDASQISNATVVVTMDADKSLKAEFAPNEWAYHPASATITDGEWTGPVAATNPVARSFSIGKFYGGQNCSLWLDLTLPVYVEGDSSEPYYITRLTVGQDGSLLHVRFGEHFLAFTQTGTFEACTKIDHIDGLGKTKVTVLSERFLPFYATPPLRSRIYEANDYLPETLVELGRCHGCGPILKGTLCLPNLTTLGTEYNFINVTSGITNLFLTSKNLMKVNNAMFSGFKLQSLTIGSTNLSDVASTAFSGAGTNLNEIVFLAHPPVETAFDNLLSPFTRTTGVWRVTTPFVKKPMTIYCSRLNPSWRAISKSMTSDERTSEYKPKDAWGVYETASAKRFYLAHRPSEFDVHSGLIFILR